MTLIAFSHASSGPELGLQLFELAASLSSRFATLQADDIPQAIAAALQQVEQLANFNAAGLIEFDENGALAASYWSPAWLDQAAKADGDPSVPRSVLERLARHEIVAVSRGEPAAENSTRDESREWVGLGIPAAVGGNVICALMVRSRRPTQRCPELALERLRLISEIFAGALQRSRQTAALKASLATIGRLNARLLADNSYLQEEIKTYHDFDDIVGESAALRVALTRLAQVAPMNASVLLLGETGTGKELFARALHDRSRRRSRALVRVNCAALPPTLIESEMFGHEKGAFTGAVAMRQGRFEVADGGSIFLDEIGDLPQDIQAKLLRVLQEGEFERVGSSRSRKVDVRVIAATHRDLEADVAAGRFRADLFYRLSVFPISLPPLRERREDVPNFVWFFIHRHQRELGRRITNVPAAVMQALQEHTWPGNVRELENVIERAMIQSTGDSLELDETFGRVRRPKPETTARAGDRLDLMQRAHIEGVLAECGWKINGVNNAAERLGLHPNTLRFRMKKLGIVCPDRPRRPVVQTGH